MSGKRIVILTNPAKSGALEQIERLRPWLKERGELVAVLSVGDDLSGFPSQADLCLVFGGDGTLLTAARIVAPLKIPLLGVNMGKLGFLADFNVEHMQKHLDEVLGGGIQPVHRMMLQVCVSGCEGQGFCALAANDVVVSSGPPFRMIDLSVDQGDSHISRYLGDGLIVATPTGTTGYNMSAGGPILVPTLDAVTITPVAPHTLSVRPIVVPSAPTIRITAAKVNPGTTVIVDGQICSGLCQGNVIEVRRAECDALIIPHPGRNFFRTLTDKLQWGRSPHHPNN